MDEATYRRLSALKAERARRYISGGGICREDSDDELGLEDYPWEWIYSYEICQTVDRATDSAVEKAQSTRKRSLFGTNSYKKAGNYDMPPGAIIGARMGNFECKVGDTVLLKADRAKEAWVGLICEFVEDDDQGMSANFMWFSTEKEIRNKEKKRMDYMQNELYITPSWDINPLASINGKARVMSAKAYLAKHPNGKVPQNSRDHGKIFICRRGCDTRSTTYTTEFVWEEVFHGSEEDINSLITRVKSETKLTRKRRLDRSEEDQADGEDLLTMKDDHNFTPRTPRKKQKVSAPTTPARLRVPSNVVTPNKRVIVKKPLEFTPLGTRILSPGYIHSSPYHIARSRLHVSAVPATLPCRGEEFSKVYANLESAILDGLGACIYISGTPGTGKTATVREAVSQLNSAVMAEELDDFIFVEINGMKVTDPHQAYSLLWEALKGERVSSSQALDLLEREFSHPNPRRVPCVVLMDELDQLVTKNQSVMYNFFNWPGLRHSRLIVLAVANTMDLPERTLSNKISSRLGLTRIQFAGYRHEQLMEIIQSRLEGVPGDIVEQDAVQFASRKVAAVSGDARRALDICRRAVELAEAENLSNNNYPDTPSKIEKVSIKQPSSKTLGRVTISTIKRAINEAVRNPLQQHLRGLPLSSKLLLAALLAKFRRTGLVESMLGEAIEEVKRIASMIVETDSLRFLQADVTLDITSGNEYARVKKLPRVNAIGAATIYLMEAGLVALEDKKGDRVGKIRIRVCEEDIKQALKDDPETLGLGF